MNLQEALRYGIVNKNWEVIKQVHGFLTREIQLENQEKTERKEDKIVEKVKPRKRRPPHQKFFDIKCSKCDKTFQSRIQGSIGFGQQCPECIPSRN